MEITKFKLIDGGRGIEVEAVQHTRKSSMLFLDKLSISRKVPVPDDVKEAVANLKYSFLNLTGHWMPPFTNYIDGERASIPQLEKEDDKGKSNKTREMVVKLWDHTRVNGALVRDDAFMIMGQIEVLDGKTVAINTPYIREDDDFHFYNETIERIENAAEVIIEFFSGDKLSIHDAKAYLLNFYKNDKKEIARIEGQTDAENSSELFRMTSAAGGSRSLEEKNPPPKPGSEGDTTLHSSKQTINKEEYKDSKKKEPEETW